MIFAVYTERSIQADSKRAVGEALTFYENATFLLELQIILHLLNCKATCKIAFKSMQTIQVFNTVLIDCNSKPAIEQDSERGVHSIIVDLKKQLNKL